MAFRRGVCHFLAGHCGVPGYEIVGLRVTDSSWLERVATAGGLKCAGAKCFWRLQSSISAYPTVAVIGTADIDRNLPVMSHADLAREGSPQLISVVTISVKASRPQPN